MKFICSGIDLKEATGKLKSVVSGASPDDILNGIKVVASKGVVSFTASDREMTVDKRLGADVKVEGSTVVEGRFFCDLCSLIGDMQVHIVVSDNTMTIKYGDNVVEATCFDSNDYPISRVFDKTSEFEIVSSELCDLVDKIEFCASIDNARPILRGICMEIDDKVVTGVALDGYRLAKMSKKLEKSTIKNTSFVVPAKALKEAVRSIGSTLDVVKILVDKSAILIDAEHIKITIVLLEGEYLNHRQFIPTSFSSTAVVPKEQLKTSIGRVKLITQNEKANALAMEF
ncbi:MAG: DNA polymerase III subunit beta, partial [Firmicutes bacterium]|nr:DNA polymerase III subunit beta [Bacillota bacterium]